MRAQANLQQEKSDKSRKSPQIPVQTTNKNPRFEKSKRGFNITYSITKLFLLFLFRFFAFTFSVGNFDLFSFCIKINYHYITFG